MKSIDIEQQLKNLGIVDKEIDFTQLSDQQLLRTSITLDLCNKYEYNLFISELKKRNLDTKYYEMRMVNS